MRLVFVVILIGGLWLVCCSVLGLWLLGFGLFVAVALVWGSVGVRYVVGRYFDCLRVVASLVVI